MGKRRKGDEFMTTIPDTPLTHEDSAQSIRIELQRMAQSIRGFGLLTTERRRQLTTSGYVDDDYLRDIALLIEANPAIAAAAQLTSAEIADHLSFSGAHKGVGTELKLSGQKLDDTLVAERASIGERALRAQKIARSINTPVPDQSVVPHLEALDREFARGRRKRRKPEQVIAARKKAEVKP
jgi:hypothetical protein